MFILQDFQSRRARCWNNTQTVPHHMLPMRFCLMHYLRTCQLSLFEYFTACSHSRVRSDQRNYSFNINARVACLYGALIQSNRCLTRLFLGSLVQATRGTHFGCSAKQLLNRPWLRTHTHTDIPPLHILKLQSCSLT